MVLYLSALCGTRQSSSISGRWMIGYKVQKSERSKTLLIFLWYQAIQDHSNKVLKNVVHYCLICTLVEAEYEI